VCERRILLANRRDEASTVHNLINFESETPTDCFLNQSRDGARVVDGKRHLPASPINTPLISGASPLYNNRTPRLNVSLNDLAVCLELKRTV